MLDPLRSYAAPRFLLGLIEADHWHGKPFNEQIFDSKDKKEMLTIHRTDKYEMNGYPVGYTIFRTSMMDEGLRQFTVEEFTPEQNPIFEGEKSPGFGNRYCIQKFAHFVYDQSAKTITHVDGAVRVFSKQEYDNHYQKITSGSDPGSKIGKRHKLFLVKGNIDLSLTKDILYEFFRYNPHLEEYFSAATRS